MVFLLFLQRQSLIGRYASSDVVDPVTGEILLECNQELTADKLDELRLKEVGPFGLLYIDGLNITSSFRDTLLADKVNSSDEALVKSIVVFVLAILNTQKFTCAV